MNWKTVLLTAIAGQLLGQILAVIHGYLAAIAIPIEYFEWFRKNLETESSVAALLVLQFAQMFIGSGILFFLCAFLISKNMQRPAPHICILYTSVWVHQVFTSSLIYRGDIIWPSYLLTAYGLAELICILMLFVGYKLAKNSRDKQ